VRQFFLILALFCAGFAFDTPYLVLGPNIEYGVFGAAAPAGLRGAFVPQANTNIDFSWIEPLGEDGYGVWKPNKTNYIRFTAGAELSPFYGTVRAGIGFAPLPPPFAILEFRFVYANENLFWSDVEMPMSSNELRQINDIWSAKYIFDNFYDRSSYSQIQSYDVQLCGKYMSKYFDIFFRFHFTLIDITSDYEEKSFDYMRSIPLYSRDYVVAEELSFAYHFSKNFSWSSEILAMFSSRWSPLEISIKEPLSYYIVSTGPLWGFNDGRSYLSINPGFFTRGNYSDVFEDSIKDRVILSIQYRHFWDFRFGK
jgi:hypothetical protein